MNKYFDSTMPNALPLSGTVGQLRSILKTLLVDGYGTTGVTSIAVAGNVATVTYASGHPFRAGVVALYSGATPSGLNGEKRILTTTTNTVTFAAPGIADGAATGSISSKMAPAGWTELFAGTLANVIALKPTVPEATGCVLRVDDTSTTNARVVAYESMSDINTGVGPTPLTSQVAGGVWWAKSSAPNATARPWILVASDRAFYFAVASGGNEGYTVHFAGDIESLKSGDAYGYLVTGGTSDQAGGSSVPDACVGYSFRNPRGGAYLVRSHTAVGQAVPAARLGAHHNGNTPDVAAGAPGYSYGGAYPNGPDNGLLTGRLEVVALGIRGFFPGLLHPVQDCGVAFSTGGTVAGTDDLAGRTLLAIRVGPPAASVASGTVLLDITGPWGN